MTRPRGTSNTNDRGSSYGRRRRKAWLVETFRADVDLVRIALPGQEPWSTALPSGPLTDYLSTYEIAHATVMPACRCYRCGRLLTAETVTVDRIIPGCEGGTYRRNNIRPACGGVEGCNETTGGALGAARRKVARDRGGVAV